LTSFFFLLKFNNMAIAKKIINFLEKNKIKYEIIEHRTVYTAFDKAATLKIKPRTVGKTLVLKTEKGLVLALIPADKNLDLKKAKKLLKAKKVDFATERVIKNKLKGVKIGAIPPFGVLWKIPTLVERAVLKESKIILNSGDHNCSIKMTPASFKKLVAELIIGSFSGQRKTKKSKKPKKKKKRK